MPTIDTETITVERAQEDFCFLALRTQWGLDEQKFEDRFGVSVHNLFGNILEELVTKGLLEYQNGKLSFTVLKGLSMVTMYLVNLFESNFSQFLKI
ncbi:MAG: hypothetical protein ACLUPK_06390 [Veillonella sp.]